MVPPQDEVPGPPPWFPRSHISPGSLCMAEIEFIASPWKGFKVTQ